VAGVIRGGKIRDRETAVVCEVGRGRINRKGKGGGKSEKT
jgi:hypothetical protein